MFPSQEFKDIVGKEPVNLLQVVTAFSMEHLWGFKKGESSGDIFEDVDLHSEHSDKEYSGDRVQQSRRQVSNTIQRLLFC